MFALVCELQTDEAGLKDKTGHGRGRKGWYVIT